MGKPNPMELGQRVVAHVEAGNTHHSVAARFDVSVRFVNDMVKLKRETGSLVPKRQGNPGVDKLTPHEDWVRTQVGTNGEITLMKWWRSCGQSAAYLSIPARSGGFFNGWG